MRLIETGELGFYFHENNCYTFMAQNNVVPFISVWRMLRWIEKGKAKEFTRKI